MLFGTQILGPRRRHVRFEELFAMADVTLTATTGRPLGSSASRRLRAEGKIPATVYGMDKDAVSVTITPVPPVRTLAMR